MTLSSITYCDLLKNRLFLKKESTKDLYDYTLKPLIPMLFNKGVVTCFAYGQTGAGKTFTMKGVNTEAIKELFRLGQEK